MLDGETFYQTHSLKLKCLDLFPESPTVDMWQDQTLGYYWDSKKTWAGYPVRGPPRFHPPEI